MSKTIDNTINKVNYTIQPLTKDHMQSTADLFIKSFCDSEPLTKGLDVQYHEYEPFVLEVIQKAMQDGLCVVAVDKNNKVIACTIAEDITQLFTPSIHLYPKLKPIFSLLEKLSEPFLKGKKFLRGKIAHVWIAIVDEKYRGKGLSTEIDMACGHLCARNGYDFAYAEFTNPVSEKITHHYKAYELCNSIDYETFKWSGTMPFKDIKGKATAYLVALKPGVTLDSLKDCLS